MVRTFDDPDTWTEPGIRHLAADGPGGDRFRTTPLADEWELYDLDDDPVNARNRARDADAAEVLAHLRDGSCSSGPHRCPAATNRGRTATRAKPA